MHFFNGSMWSWFAWKMVVIVGMMPCWSSELSFSMIDSRKMDVLMTPWFARDHDLVYASMPPWVLILSVSPVIMVTMPISASLGPGYSSEVGAEGLDQVLKITAF